MGLDLLSLVITPLSSLDIVDEMLLVFLMREFAHGTKEKKDYKVKF